MAITTVNVSGVSVDVYGSINELKAYAAGVLLPAGVTFTSDNDRLKRLLVTTTRLFERTAWEGEPTDLATPQPLAWPRTGVTDGNGQAVDPGTVPPAVFDGFFEMAVFLDTDTTGLAALLTGSSGSNVRRTRTRRKVGELETEDEQENFVGTRHGPNRRPVWPDSVLGFLRPFLRSDASALAGCASGTAQKSAFQNGPEAEGILSDFGYNRGGIP